MRNRRFFLAVGVVSLLLGSVAAVLWVHGDDPGVQFSFRNTRWEIRSRSGRIRLDNAPERRKAREPRPREQMLRQTLHDEPWGSPRYREALAELKGITPARQAAAPGIAYVEYALPLWLLMLTGIPGLLWLASLGMPGAVRLKRRHLPHVMPAFRFQANRRLFTAAAAMSLLLVVATTMIGARSFGARTVAFTVKRNGLDYALASETGTLGIDNGPQIDRFLADRARRMDSLKAQVDRESESALFVRGLMRMGDRYFIQVNSKSLSPGDSIESDGERIGIESISPSRIVVTRNGAQRVVRRLGESLKSGLDGNRRVANLRRQLMLAGLARPPVMVRHAIPFWSIAVCFAILPAAWLAGLYRRQNHIAAGRCMACGYNLTGNTSGVCPECGTPLS